MLVIKKFEGAYKAIAEEYDREPDPAKKAELLRNAESSFGPWMNGYYLWLSGVRGHQLLVQSMVRSLEAHSRAPEYFP